MRRVLLVFLLAWAIGLEAQTLRRPLRLRQATADAPVSALPVRCVAQGATVTNTATTSAFACTPEAGDLVVVFVSAYSDVPDQFHLTPTGGGISYQRAGTMYGTTTFSLDHSLSYWYACDIPAGAFTVTGGVSAGSYATVIAYIIDGPVESDCYNGDAIGAAPQTTSAPTVTTVATPQPDSLAITAVTTSGPDTVAGTTATWTRPTNGAQTNNTTLGDLYTQYREVDAPYEANWALTATVDEALVATLSFTVSGGGVLVPPVDYGGCIPDIPPAPGYTTACSAFQNSPAIILVNTLSDNESPLVAVNTGNCGVGVDCYRGSLRSAMRETLANPCRVIVFETSGEIVLTIEPVGPTEGPYIQTNLDCMVIAGQTAPTAGVNIRGSFWLNNDNVLMEHLRVRPRGDLGCTSGINSWNIGGSPANHIIQRVSISGHQDDGLATSAAQNVIYHLVFIAEGMHFLGPTCGGGGAAGSRNMLNYSTGVFYHQVVSANSVKRHPTNGGGSRTVMVNSLIYNWNDSEASLLYNMDASGYASAGPWHASFVGNRYIGGPGTCAAGNTNAFNLLGTSTNFETAGNELYRVDNTFIQGGSTCAVTDLLNTYTGGLVTFVSGPPSDALIPGGGFTPMASTAVEAYVVARAGARASFPDAFDTATRTCVTTRTCANTRTTPTVIPTIAVEVNPLDDEIPTTPHAAGNCGGTPTRTRLQCWLLLLAQAVEP